MNSGASAPPSMPTLMAGARRVLELSLGQMLWSRRSLFMGVLVSAPVVLALFARAAEISGASTVRINGASVDGPGLFDMVVGLFFVRFIVPVLGVFHGTALIADEVEDKTLTYLFTRPIRRGAVLLGKYLAYLVSTASMVLPSLVIVYFLTIPMADVIRVSAVLATDIGVLGLGLAAYGGVFALAGTVLKRPVVMGLLFAFGWEPIALVLPGLLKRLTVIYYLQMLVPAAAAQGNQASEFQAVAGNGPDAIISLLCLLAIAVASVVLAARAIEEREYVLEQ